MFSGCGGGTSTKSFPPVTNSGSGGNTGTGGTSGTGGTGGGTSTGPPIQKVEVPAFTGVQILGRMQVEATGNGLSYEWSEVDASGNPKAPPEASFTSTTAAVTTLSFGSGTLPGKKFIKVKVQDSSGAFSEQTREVEFITGGRIVTVTLTDQAEPTQGDSIKVEIRNAADGKLTTQKVDFEFQVMLANSSNVLKANPVTFTVGTLGTNEASFGQFLSGPDMFKSVEFSHLLTITGKATEQSSGKVHFSGIDFSNPNPAVSTGQQFNTGKTVVVVKKIDP